jgi:hypothetical protein
VEDIIELGLPQLLQEQQTVTYKLSLNRIIFKQVKTITSREKQKKTANNKRYKIKSVLVLSHHFRLALVFKCEKKAIIMGRDYSVFYRS